MDIFKEAAIEELKSEQLVRQPVVSVWCLTYNHESYIKDALEGFVSQKTDFPFEVVIFDDASTDGAPEIIKEYANRYPEIFHVLFAKKNVYNHPLRTEILAKFKEKYLRGKYVAYCEGDDYWIHPKKLQLQIEHLETHPKCAMVVHAAIMFDCSKNTVRQILPCNEEGIVSAEEVIIQKKGFLTTASIVVRKEIIKLQSFSYCGVGDWPLKLNALANGDVYYIDRIMSVYRMFSSGSWTERMENNLQQKADHIYDMMQAIKKYNNYTNGKYKIYMISQMHAYVSSFIYGCLKKDKNILQRNLESSQKDEDKHRFWKEIEKSCHQEDDESYVSEELLDFVNGNENVLIWGIGAYATMVTKQLWHAGTECAGYVISDNQTAQETFIGKPVWRMQDIPYDKTKYGLVIAINPIIWHELEPELRKYEIENYFCPFMWKECEDF